MRVFAPFSTDSGLTTLAAAAAVVTLVANGCSDDTGTNPSCPDGTTFLADADACVTEGSPTDGGGSDADGASDDGDADGYVEGACEKRSSYLQIYKPNVYVVFDRSASMSGSKMMQAKSGLDQVANKVADRIRMGLSVYPKPSAGCSTREQLELGDHTSKEIKMSYGSESGAGGTPTGVALYQVRAGDRLDDPMDSNQDERENAVILITDGEPNDEEICQNPRDPFKQARKLRDNGVSTYVVGFQSDGDPNTLDKLAKAGGTNASGSNRFYDATTANDLTNAVLDITNSSVSCQFDLDPVPPKGSSVNVSVGGTDVPESDYQFDDENGQVTVTGSSCDTLRKQAVQGTSLTIDVGCPMCKLAGESCQNADECCDERCVGGVCKEACRNRGEDCVDDSECCSKQCAATDDKQNIGQCVSK